MLYQHNSLVIHFCYFSQSGAGCRVRSCSRCWGNWSRNMENQRLVVWPLHAECGHQYGRPGVSAWSDCWGQSPQREACLADRKHGAGGVQRNRCSKAPWVTSIILYHYESILCGHGCILTLFLCISWFACLFVSFFALVWMQSQTRYKGEDFIWLKGILSLQTSLIFHGTLLFKKTMTAN